MFMKRLLWLLVFISFSLFSWAQQVLSAEKVLQEAMKEAQKRNKKILLIFEASGVAGAKRCKRLWKMRVVKIFFKKTL
jgi:thioredoxin-related protein